MATSSTNASEVPRGRRTVLVALEYFEPLKTAVYDHARRAGWSVLDLQNFNMRIPRPCRPDGVLFWLPSPDVPFAKRMLRLGVPVVQINDTVLPQKCCCVVEDRRAVGRAAAEHFAERGFRNMAFLHSDTLDDATFKLTGQSFVERARALGARADLIAVQRQGQPIPWTRFGTLAKRFERAISRLELPLGIFTYHDVMAIRICQFCEAIGLSVPEQVAVLGRNNDPHLCDYAPVPLSSVDINHFEQGRIAAELLERLMDGEPAPAEPILIPPAGVVGRQSTDVLAVPDVDTARGLRYIWAHLAQPLQVPDIAEAVGVSRRKLERHFRRYLHRSVSEEFTRKRIERSCELLTGTELTGREIARQVGFDTQTYFGKVFRKAMGMTPRQYRLAQTAKGGEAQSSQTDNRQQFIIGRDGVAWVHSVPLGGTPGDKTRQSRICSSASPTARVVDYDGCPGMPRAGSSLAGCVEKSRARAAQNACRVGHNERRHLSEQADFEHVRTVRASRPCSVRPMTLGAMPPADRVGEVQALGSRNAR